MVQKSKEEIERMLIKFNEHKDKFQTNDFVIAECLNEIDPHEIKEIIPLSDEDSIFLVFLNRDPKINLNAMMYSWMKSDKFKEDLKSIEGD